MPSPSAEPVVFAIGARPGRSCALLGADELSGPLEVVGLDEDLAGPGVAHTVAGACTDIRLPVIAGDAFRPQQAAHVLGLERVADDDELNAAHQA